MGAPSVTPEVSELIQGLRAQGKSFRDLAKIASEQLKKSISHTAIKRHLDSIEGKKRNQPQELAERAARRAGAQVEAPQPEEPAQPRVILGEIEALEREAEKLQQLLGTSMPHRDRTALNAELRATFASIAKARKAEREEAETQSADAAWVLAKLKRFDAMAAEDAAPTTEDEVPPATRTATTG